MNNIRIGETTIAIWGEYVITRFDDGSEVVAAVNTTAEDVARAESLGYGEDLFAMCVDHEIGHTLLANLAGLPHSPVLYRVAHDEAATEEESYAEEAAVLGLQRFAKENGTSIVEMAQRLYLDGPITD